MDPLHFLQTIKKPLGLTAIPLTGGAPGTKHASTG